MLHTHLTRAAGVALLAASALLAGCDDQQSAEKTGQEVGRAVDQAAQKAGTVAGDVAAGAGRMLQDAGRAVERATRSEPEPAPSR